MTEQVVTERAIDAVNSRLEMIGSRYPREFVFATGDTIMNTLREYLQKKGEPQEVIAAFDMSIMMERLTGALYQQQRSNIDYAELVDTVTQTIELIAKLGGTFYSGTTEFPAS